MKRYPAHLTKAAIVLAGAAALAGCSGLGSGALSPDPRYRCEQDLQFTVRFAHDTAVLEGARGNEVLLRDAGGQGAQTVYTNPRLRAEFGLGADGRGALLQYLQNPPLVTRCLRG